MSLSAALNIGKSALATHQAALQVTSNNIANVGNPNYTRQVAHLSAGQDVFTRPGLLVGSGVNLQSIQRQIDDALEGRLRSSTSDSQSASVRQQWIGRVESVFQELGDNDLSTQMSAFFNSWSNLANKPQDTSLRQIVLQNGQTLASTFQTLHGQFDKVEHDLGQRMTTLARDVDALAGQIADLNRQIVLAEGANQGAANNLRDQRDAVLKQLSGLIDIKVQDLGNGNMNVMVGSEPLVLGDTSRGFVMKQTSTADGIDISFTSAANGATFDVTSGQIGGLLGIGADLRQVIADLDSLAGGLIFELNKLHSSGQGLEGFSSITAANGVASSSAPLNSAAADLPFTPVNGSFVVHVKQKSTGLVTSTLVQVNLDGLNDDHTTLESLQASLDGIDGITSSIASGRLRLEAGSGDTEISFSQDSSGVLAALGMNAFFKGTDARDIAINADLKARPALLAASRNGAPTDNQTAQAIAALESLALRSLSGGTLQEKYEGIINGLAVAAQSASTGAEAAGVVLDTLILQREALSGVSLDEEAVNLIREQRAFQGAARIIAAIDEMMKTLLQLA